MRSASEPSTIFFCFSNFLHSIVPSFSGFVFDFETLLLIRNMFAVSRLGSLLRRCNRTTIVSELKGFSRAYNESSLQSSSRFSVPEHCDRCLISRFSSFQAFKSLPKNLVNHTTRKMSTTAAVLNSTAVEATNSGLKLLVTKGPHAQKAVGIWLFGCAAWVFSLVVLGGITRLTRSGLSMTDWKFTGGLPPLTQEEWVQEFEKYQQSPEYKRINKGMSVEDFKFIYWMEYAHRMWGRGLGLVFSFPFAYFIAKGYITRQLGLRLSALFALGAGQGLIGWWMVKSGLEEPRSEWVQPRVSPYRLATHLTSAFVIYCGILWTALSVVMPEAPSGALNWVHGATKIRRLALPASFIVGLTAVSGAYVAGNDAGHAYNTFPKMGDVWIPDDIFSMEPLIRNFFENTSLVQLNHRILAMTTLSAIGALWFASRRIEVHPAVQSLIGATLGMAALQVTLGLSTLLMYVPTSLASAHQAGALTLLTFTLLLVHTVRKPSPALLKSLASVSKPSTVKVL
ncbi:Cytochrome c oxidase assembly protein COX15 [Rhynchospora pubera]|uniref:Cytochrome c oxidase assembly protein COX15 n=1 Tax=Rhynchospora pubera TaxID=906938 RepID=A0AAV8BWG7_9POAL|nr:Cytochrome c oxidase assembly protein COX15 [Rhynchospora pubera]